MSEGLAKMGSTVQYVGCFPCNGPIKPTHLSETLLMFVTLVYQHISFRNTLILSYSTVFFAPIQEARVANISSCQYLISIHISYPISYRYLKLPTPQLRRSCYLPPVVPALAAETLLELCTSVRCGHAWRRCVGGLIYDVQVQMTQICIDGIYK